MFKKNNCVLNHILISIALGVFGLLAFSSFLLVSATDSSSACWNMGGIIDQQTGACILPECPPGTVRESTILTGTKCNPVSELHGNEKQLATKLSSSSSPPQNMSSEG